MTTTKRGNHHMNLTNACGDPASCDAVVYVQQCLAIDTAVSSLISSCWEHIHRIVGQCMVQLLTFRRKRSRNCDGKQGRDGGRKQHFTKLAANSRFPSNIEHRLSAAATDGCACAVMMAGGVARVKTAMIGGIHVGRPRLRL